MKNMLRTEGKASDAEEPLEVVELFCGGKKQQIKFDIARLVSIKWSKLEE